MNILLIYAHHEPKSFNGAMYQQTIASLTAAGHSIKTTDLYDTSFNPVSTRKNFESIKNPDFLKQQIEETYATAINGFAPDVRIEQEKVEWCDIMIWQFPLWWFGLPGILKGWVDRVFAMGRFYSNGQVYENGRFKGKKALLSLTTGGAEDTYQAGGLHGDLASILRPIHRGIFQFVGFSVLTPHVVYGPVRKLPEELKAELARWSKRLEHLGQEEEMEVGHYR